jgi:hypothetical protein
MKGEKMNDTTITNEAWPTLADTATVGDLKIYVYKDTAMIDPPLRRYDDSNEIFLTADELRQLAHVATWAADRLDAR